MNRLVADATALAAWFDGDSPLRAQYEAGSLVVVGPTHLPHDLLGQLVSRSRADADTAARLAREVANLGFELRDPPTTELARWIARGLDPRRAAYVALAASLGVPLATHDATLREAAGTLVTEA
jgi:predicted nucleic acid-binding protein